MKKRIIAFCTLVGLTFAFAACSKKAAKTEKPVETPYQKVMDHLNTGGDFLFYTNIHGDLDNFGKTMGNLFTQLGADDPDLTRLGKASPKIFQVIGLSSVDAIGASSTPIDNGLHQNSVFVYMPSGGKGLLNFTVAENKPFTVQTMAPKDAALAFESQLHLSNLPAVVREVATMVGGDAVGKKIDGVLAMPAGPLGVPVSKIVSDLNGRIYCFASASKNADMVIPARRGMPPQKIPAVDFVVAIDNLGWIVDQLKPMAQGMGFAATDEGNLSVLTLTDQQPSILEYWRPVVAKDKKTGRLYVASSMKYLQAALAGKDRLADDPQYKTAMSGLAAKGVSCSYISPEYGKYILRIEKMNLAKMNSGAQAAAMAHMQEFFQKLMHMDVSQSAVSTVLPDGILMRARQPYSYKIVMLAPLGAVAAMAIPAFEKVRARSQTVTIKNNLRMLFAAGQQYLVEKGASSVTGAELINSGKYLPPMKPVEGESYDDIVITPDTTELSVTTARGQRVTVSFR